MSMLGMQADELRDKAKLLRAHADGLAAPLVVPSTKELMALTMLDSASRMEEAADTIISLRDRLQESCGQVPEQEKRGNGSERGEGGFGSSGTGLEA